MLHENKSSLILKWTIFSLSFVVTIFLDLFDRIHAYSSVFHQQIEFEEWADRWMQLQVEGTVRDLVTQVEEELNKHNQVRFECNLLSMKDMMMNKLQCSWRTKK